MQHAAVNCWFHTKPQLCLANLLSNLCNTLGGAKSFRYCIASDEHGECAACLLSQGMLGILVAPLKHPKVEQEVLKKEEVN